MRYMIHAAPPRMWYVEDFLIPSMTAQGIQDEEITIWNDEKMEGNLPSFLASMRDCAGQPGGLCYRTESYGEQKIQGIDKHINLKYTDKDRAHHA